MNGLQFMTEMVEKLQKLASGVDPAVFVYVALTAIIVLSLIQVLILGLCFALVLNSGNGVS